MRTNPLHRTVALAAAGLALAWMSAPASAAAASYSQIVVFGDSLSDTGNLLRLTTVLSGLGVDGFPAPEPQAENYFNGRFSDGRVAVEVLADGLKGTLGDGQSLFLQNYSYGGARTGFDGNNIPQTGLRAQLMTFQQSFAPGVTADPDALYVVWGGGNDLRSIAAAPAMAEAIVNDALGNISTIVGTLYGMGARHFLVPNLPNVALTPEIRDIQSPAMTAFAEQASIGFNTALQQLVFPGLRLSLPNIDLMTVDVMQAQTDITNDPAAFGMTNVTNSCFTGYSGVPGIECGTPGTYLYWDRVHPTTAAHEILGREMIAAVTAVPEPATVLMMASGVLALLSLGRRRRDA